MKFINYLKSIDYLHLFAKFVLRVSKCAGNTEGMFMGIPVITSIVSIFLSIIEYADYKSTMTVNQGFVHCGVLFLKLTFLSYSIIYIAWEIYHGSIALTYWANHYEKKEKT
jgi:hypothetical protein